MINLSNKTVKILYQLKNNQNIKFAPCQIKTIGILSVKHEYLNYSNKILQLNL